MNAGPSLDVPTEFPISTGRPGVEGPAAHTMDDSTWILEKLERSTNVDEEESVGAEEPEDEGNDRDIIKKRAAEFAGRAEGGSGPRPPTTKFPSTTRPSQKTAPESPSRMPKPKPRPLGVGDICTLKTIELKRELKLRSLPIGACPPQPPNIPKPTYRLEPLTQPPLFAHAAAWATLA